MPNESTNLWAAELVHLKTQNLPKDFLVSRWRAPTKTAAPAPKECLLKTSRWPRDKNQ